jgi:hypothetical protein
MSVSLHAELPVVANPAGGLGQCATGRWIGALAAARVPLRRLALWSGGVAPGERLRAATGPESCSRALLYGCGVVHFLGCTAACVKVQGTLL